MKLLYVTGEAAPYAASGGLGDVMGSLPAALAASGEVDVRVVMPLLLPHSHNNLLQTL